MKVVSKWARKNQQLSRVIIGFSHLLTIINSICIGVLLFIFNWGVSKWSLVVAANLFFIAYIFYPEKLNGKKRYQNLYLRQKIYDFVFVVLYATVITLGVNNFLMSNPVDYNSVKETKAEFIVHRHKFKPETPI